MSTRTKANKPAGTEKPTCGLAFLYTGNKKSESSALTYLLLLRISCQTLSQSALPPGHYRFALRADTADNPVRYTFLIGKLLMLFLFLQHV